jgi:hypothetical protein
MEIKRAKTINRNFPKRNTHDAKALEKCPISPKIEKCTLRLLKDADFFKLADFRLRQIKTFNLTLLETL